MRNVAVTEGDKVETQQVFGWEIDAYQSSEIAEAVNAVTEGDVEELLDEYYSLYDIVFDCRDLDEFCKLVAGQARIEIGIERFVLDHNYQAVVTHFDDLSGLSQMPGLAIQRLEEKGYGFAPKEIGKQLPWFVL